ncbi:MAG TPA: hypothetical protein VL068_04640, partial [Microthrixaceae bacterium]|nr:hypothetical protein [Microthrixaceae bacterium]
RTARDSGDNSWLFFHKSEGGVAGWNPEDHPNSVISARTNDQVAQESAELLALDELGPEGVWHFAGRELKLTNLDRVMFPGGPTRRSNLDSNQDEPNQEAPTTEALTHDALTKRDLIRHYATVAPLMIPFMKGHPVNLHRFPKGIGEPGFWHKAVPNHAPDWIERWDNPDARPGETKTYFVASEPATLAWLANYGVVEVHPWTSTTTHPDSPTFAIFDIDPGERTSWEDLLALARLHRDALQHLGVVGLPNVSGQRGIQIRVPLLPGVSFAESREWVEAVSRAIGRARPDLVSWKWKVGDRDGLARLDFTQNARNKTIVAPYSPRPAVGGPVSTPIRWEELDDPGLRPNRWTMNNLSARLIEAGDLLGSFETGARPLPAIGAS